MGKFSKGRMWTLAAALTVSALMMAGCSERDSTPPPAPNYNPTDGPYTLNININPVGGGEVSRSPNNTAYSPGTPVYVTATAHANYEFVSWSGALNSSENPIMVTMDGSLTLTANFQTKSGGGDNPATGQTWNCGYPTEGAVKATLNGGTLTISGVGAMADYGTNTMPWVDYRSYITQIIIGEGVTSIGEYAFYECTGLTSVTIGNSVRTIGNGAFSYCSGLTSVTIPNNVTSIGSDAFDRCTGLMSVTIGSSVRTIGGWAFGGCSGLTSVISLSAVPPDISFNSFTSLHSSVCLYVPAAGISAYSSDSSQWHHSFSCIKDVGSL